MRFYTYAELRDRGVKYSRQHLRRLEKQKLFPAHFNLDDGGKRIAWEATLIDRHVANQNKRARVNAKAAREANTPKRKAHSS